MSGKSVVLPVRHAFTPLSPREDSVCLHGQNTHQPMFGESIREGRGGGGDKSTGSGSRQERQQGQREEREALKAVSLYFLLTGINDSGHALTLHPCHSHTGYPSITQLLPVSAPLTHSEEVNCCPTTNLSFFMLFVHLGSLFWDVEV